MIRIESRSGEPLEKTLRRFKKACEKEGLVKEMKRNAYFEKPSDKMRRRVRNQMKRIVRETRTRDLR
jgi:small subunit ribosomal protein S21